MAVCNSLIRHHDRILNRRKRLWHHPCFNISEQLARKEIKNSNDSEEIEMSIQKKSLISMLSATKKAIATRPVASSPVASRPVAERPAGKRPVGNRPVGNRPVFERRK